MKDSDFTLSRAESRILRIEFGSQNNGTNLIMILTSILKQLNVDA